MRGVLRHFPTIMTGPDGDFLASQSGDTMTHPNHRRKGLFRSLFSETKQLATKNDIKFIYGLPNSQSHHGLIRFGWKEIYQWQFLQIGFRNHCLER